MGISYKKMYLRVLWTLVNTTVGKKINLWVYDTGFPNKFSYFRVHVQQIFDNNSSLRLCNDQLLLIPLFISNAWLWTWQCTNSVPYLYQISFLQHKLCNTPLCYNILLNVLDMWHFKFNLHQVRLLGSLLDYKIVLCKVSGNSKAQYSQIRNATLICNAIFWWIPFVQVIGHKHPKRRNELQKKSAW
jgi:hypothetical protein